MNAATRNESTRPFARAWILGGVAAVAALAALGGRALSGQSHGPGSNAPAEPRRAEPARPSGSVRELRRDERRETLHATTVGAVPGAEEPVSVPELENPVLAAQSRHFASSQEELAFWNERLRGERLTLDHQEQSLERAERVLDSAGRSSPEQTQALEKRRAVLKAKIAEQARQVGEIELRISELKQ